MKTLTNKTRKPIRLKLPGDKVLFLGASRSAQILDSALEQPSVKKLVDAGDLEVVDVPGQRRGGKEAPRLPGRPRKP